MTIYDAVSRKKKRTIPELEVENLSIQCREILGCAFSNSQEKQHLVTLCGDGDWCAILWQWDQMKMLAKMDLNIVDPIEPMTFQISLYKVTDLVCVVTGPNTYKYLKTEDGMRSFKEMHSQLRPYGSDDISTMYTCHCWAKDKVQLVIALSAAQLGFPLASHQLR